MASTKCWHCHERAQMVVPAIAANACTDYPFPTAPSVVFPDSRFSEHGEGDSLEWFHIYSCVNCGYPNIAVVSVESEEALYDGFDPEEHIARWLPIEPLGRDYPYAPEGIASIASEVHKCKEIGANRAAVIMARSALERIVADQESVPSKKRLYERIENLRKEGVITSRTADAATAIRLCGNDYAHNTLEPVDYGYVDIVVQILDSMIDDLYSNPSLVAKAKAYAKGRGGGRKECDHDTN